MAKTTGNWQERQLQLVICSRLLIRVNFCLADRRIDGKVLFTTTLQKVDIFARTLKLPTPFVDTYSAIVSSFTEHLSKNFGIRRKVGLQLESSKSIATANNTNLHSDHRQEQ